MTCKFVLLILHIEPYSAYFYVLTYFAYFQLPDKKYQYFCPPPVPKNKKSVDDASAPGAMPGEDYSLILHCTVGHMRRVDGALLDIDDGKKAVNFFAPPPTPTHFTYSSYSTYFSLQGIPIVRHSQSLDFGIIS